MQWCERKRGAKHVTHKWGNPEEWVIHKGVKHVTGKACRSEEAGKPEEVGLTQNHMQGTVRYPRPAWTDTKASTTWHITNKQNDNKTCSGLWSLPVGHKHADTNTQPFTQGGGRRAGGVFTQKEGKACLIRCG